MLDFSVYSPRMLGIKTSLTDEITTSFPISSSRAFARNG